MKNGNRHTISVLVQNKFGVLARVAGLFSGRGYNISSLTVNPTLDPEVSKMTIVTSGDDQIIEQIYKQLRKLIEVITVEDLVNGEFIERELALFRIGAETSAEKTELAKLAEAYCGKVLSDEGDQLGIEINGSSEEVDNFIRMIKDFTVLEMARSGRVAISKK